MKHWNCHVEIFNCEDAAQQVLMSSVRLSDSKVEILLLTALRMFQNVPECMQNVPECMQNVPECSRMHAESSRMFQNTCRMFQNVPECMQNVTEYS